jgi:hypothetical protein
LRILTSCELLFYAVQTGVFLGNDFPFSHLPRRARLGNSCLQWANAFFRLGAEHPLP